jgi:hypothetical protein
MKLSIHPIPLSPMEAHSVDTIPTGANWQYEPKWDGFRCIIFRNGEKVEIQSKAGKSLSRYFPELQAAAWKLTAKAFLLCGNGSLQTPNSIPCPDAPVNGTDHHRLSLRKARLWRRIISFQREVGRRGTRWNLSYVRRILDAVRCCSLKQAARSFARPLCLPQ